MDRLRLSAGDHINTLNDRIHAGKAPAGLAKLDRTDWDKVRGEPAARAKARTELAAIFDGHSRSQFQLKAKLDPGQQWDVTKDGDGRVTVAVPFNVLLQNPVGMTQLQIEAFGHIRSVEPVDIDRVARAQERDEMPEFELIGLEFRRVGSMMKR